LELIAELPYSVVRCVPENADGFRSGALYISIPKIATDAVVGVDLAANQKRYRDENGVLTISLSEVTKQTQAEADAYYINGEQYIYKGMLFTYKRAWIKTADGAEVECSRFSHGDYNNFIDPASRGTFLPDVASVGNEIVSVRDKRFQPLLCLTKSLKKLSSRTYVRRISWTITR
jgi:hypothetical protein